MNDVDHGDETANTFRRLGAISLVLGVLSLSRLVVELYQTRTMYGTDRYFASLAADFLLAIATCLTGVGLLRTLRWATACATITAVAVFVTSAARLLDHGKVQLEIILVLGMNHNVEMFLLASRLFLNGIHVIFGPIVAGHVYIDLQSRDSEDLGTREEKRRFWWRAGAAVLACALVELLLHLIPPHQADQLS